MSVVMSEMDMESSSAFSPSEPDIDSAFVSKHNQSAEIYQVKFFKRTAMRRSSFFSHLKTMWMLY